MYLAIATQPNIDLVVQKLTQSMTLYNLAGLLPSTLCGTSRELGHLNCDLVVLFWKTWLASVMPAMPDSSCSISAHCFSLGSGTISWAARKQQMIAQSTCHAEYIATAKSCCEAMWLCMLTAEIRLDQLYPTPLLTNNKAALALSKDSCFHACTKHIHIKYHYICECIENGEIHVSYVPTKDNVALQSLCQHLHSFAYENSSYGTQFSI